MKEHESNLTTPQSGVARTRSFATKAGLAIAGTALIVFGALAAPLAWQTVNVSANSARMEVAAPALQIGSTLDEDQAALAALYEAVSPSVVNIQVESTASATQLPEIPGFQLPQMPEGEAPSSAEKAPVSSTTTRATSSPTTMLLRMQRRSSSISTTACGHAPKSWRPIRSLTWPSSRSHRPKGWCGSR